VISSHGNAKNLYSPLVPNETPHFIIGKKLKNYDASNFIASLQKHACNKHWH
jgi:hypothetical protein